MTIRRRSTAHRRRVELRRAAAHCWTVDAVGRGGETCCDYEGAVIGRPTAARRAVLRAA